MRLAEAIKGYVGVAVRAALQDQLNLEEMQALAKAERNLDEACSRVEPSVKPDFKEFSFQE